MSTLWDIGVLLHSYAKLLKAFYIVVCENISSNMTLKQAFYVKFVRYYFLAVGLYYYVTNSHKYCISTPQERT